MLLWATSDLETGREGVSDPPIRYLDIPDPVNPPSGCRFHTRCPEARTACTQSCPELTDHEGDGRRTACFRNEADHDYWESDPLSDDSASGKPTAPRETADGD